MRPSPIPRRLPSATAAALQAPAEAALPRLCLTEDELGTACGCSGRFLRDHFPDLPRIRRGGRVLYPIDAVRAFLERVAAPDTSSSM